MTRLLRSPARVRDGSLTAGTTESGISVLLIACAARSNAAGDTRMLALVLVLAFIVVGLAGAMLYGTIVAPLGSAVRNSRDIARRQ